MREWDLVFPQYGLKNHKGYSTDEHWKALETHGPTPVHRFSFWPVREHSPHTLWTGYPRQGDLFGPEPLTDVRGSESNRSGSRACARRTAVPQDVACIQ